MAFIIFSPKPRWAVQSLMFAAFLGLAGCSNIEEGDADAPPLSGSTSSGTAPGSSSSSSSSGTVSSGNLVDANGDPINVDIVVSNAALPAEGSTAMHLDFTDLAGDPVPVPGTWSAYSPCVGVGRAEISAPVTSTSRVSFNYVATGCVGDDKVTFTSTGQKLQTVSTTINVGEDVVSFITWQSTEPDSIAIRGSGGNEKAIITFRVNGLSSSTVADQLVNFRLEGVSGGVTLAESSAVSDANGFVRATVQSGSTPTLVTVVAEHVETGIEAQSGGLTVATGLAADNHFNIALSIRNPKAWNRINDQGTDVTVAVTDRSGNPVVDGTVVNFVSEKAGVITSSCKTAQNTCTVPWKPDGRNPSDGRAKVFATVKGTEDFIDNNGNKIFDDGDTFDERFDLGEPYSDNNSNGMYDVGEHFVDSNGNGMRDGPDGLWNGLHCQHSALCAQDGKFVDLGAQTTIYMSNGKITVSEAICEYGDFGVPEKLKFEAGVLRTIGGLYLSDGNTGASNPVDSACPMGNPLPAGTKIAFSVSGGTLQGTTSWTVSDDARAPTGPYGIKYKPAEKAGSEVLTLSVEVPGEEAKETDWTLTIEPATM